MRVKVPLLDAAKVAKLFKNLTGNLCGDSRRLYQQLMASNQ